MMETTLETIWDRYAQCWSAPESERNRFLATCVADDVTYRDPHQEALGRDALQRAMVAFAKQFPGQHFVIDGVTSHHLRSLARWRLVAPDGSTSMSGTSAASHREDGRLHEISGFFQSRATAKARVAIVLTSHDRLGRSGRNTGFWFEELAAPYETFAAAGLDMVLTSPRGGAAPVDPASLLDASVTPAVRRFQANRHAMARVESTVALETLAEQSVDAVFLVGGHGVMWDFPESTALGTLIQRTVGAGGIVAAVCHGAAGLLAAAANVPTLVKGRALTAFSDAEESIVGATEVVPFLLEKRLREIGAKFSSGAPFGVHVVRDGQLITGQNPASSNACAMAVVAALDERALRTVAA